jgi:hypothetical protein
MMKHPIQPVAPDKHGTPRFKPNKIVEFLANNRLNELATMDFPQEDWEQLAQLIGYSLSGFGELSYVSDETYGAAAAMAEDGLTEEEARLDTLRTTLADLRASLREPIAKLYGIHPDDLAQPLED